MQHAEYVKRVSLAPHREWSQQPPERRLQTLRHSGAGQREAQLPAPSPNLAWPILAPSDVDLQSLFFLSFQHHWDPQAVDSKSAPQPAWLPGNGAPAVRLWQWKWHINAEIRINGFDMPQDYCTICVEVQFNGLWKQFCKHQMNLNVDCQFLASSRAPRALLPPPQHSLAQAWRQSHNSEDSKHSAPKVLKPNISRKLLRVWELRVGSFILWILWLVNGFSSIRSALFNLVYDRPVGKCHVKVPAFSTYCSSTWQHLLHRLVWTKRQIPAQPALGSPNWVASPWRQYPASATAWVAPLGKGCDSGNLFAAKCHPGIPWQPGPSMSYASYASYAPGMASVDWRSATFPMAKASMMY